MSTPSDRAAPGGWTEQRERSNLWLLRLMRGVALTAGRRATRLLLPPIALYFCASSAALRRDSSRYLGRALGRPARWRDVYRHIHCFAATILDRVYLLQQGRDGLELNAQGLDLLEGSAAGGDGVLLIGAHFGSFEALRALGLGHTGKVAMVMYEDNARQINSTLAAIAPQAKLQTIALGRVGAMLALQRWLDEGGVAGLLADRTLPGPAARSRTLRLPFLGAPARFSDGPFRLAAMLRRRVIFMAGIYQGGRTYELRFIELADFSQPAAEPARRDAQIHDALQRYVAILETLCREAPYNWFNFFDFWADDETGDANR